MTMMYNFDAATRAVLRVGGGRGFVVDGEWTRLVITAAHCLPQMPPAHGASYTEERTYSDLLGPLGAETTVWAECLFADPVADIAVLGEPDSQELYEQARAYNSLLITSEPDIPDWIQLSSSCSTYRIFMRPSRSAV
jgi:hypothetical protein